MLTAPSSPKDWLRVGVGQYGACGSVLLPRESWGGLIFWAMVLCMLHPLPFSYVPALQHRDYHFPHAYSVFEWVCWVRHFCKTGPSFCCRLWVRRALGVAVGVVALRPSHRDDPPVWNRSLFLGLLPLSRHHFLAPLALGQVRTVQNTRCGLRPSCSLPHFILAHSLCRILLGTDLALMSGRPAGYDVLPVGGPEAVVSPGAPSTVWWPVSRSF